MNQLKTEIKQNPTVFCTNKKISADNLLKDSHLKYKIIADFTCDIEVCRDNNGQVIYVSPAFERITGYSCDDYISGKLKPLDIVHPDDKTIFKQYISKILTKEEIVDLEYRCVKKNNNIINLQINSQPILDSNGIYLGRRTSIRDITKKKEIEHELIHAKENYTNLVNNIGVGIMVINKSYKIEYSNPRLLHWFPHIEDDKNPSCRKLFNHTKKPDVCENCPAKLVFSDGKVHQSAFTIEKDSQLKSYKIISTPIKDDGGTITSAVEIIEDITIEKQQEAEIINTKNQLQEVIDNTSELIIGFNLDKTVYMWNKRIEKLSGHKKSNMLGRHIRNIPIFENSNFLEESLDNIRKNLPISKDNLILISKNGKRRIIKPTYSTIRDSELKGILLFGQDITLEIEKRQLISGRTYLIIDQTNDTSLHIFHQITQDAKKGLIISRFNPNEEYSEYPQDNLEKINLSRALIQQGHENNKPFDILMRRIKKFCKSVESGIILLDRIDYLIYQFSFEDFLLFIYEANEFISKSSANLLIRLNPLIFDNKQFAALKEECPLLPSQDIKKIALEEPLIDIIQFIHTNQQMNSVVTFKSIKDEFSIVDVTVQKRLYSLLEKKLIHITREGRSKTVTLSEKGKQLLINRIHN